MLPCSCFPAGVTLSRREGSLSPGTEMLRGAQHDHALLRQGSTVKYNVLNLNHALAKGNIINISRELENWLAGAVDTL